MMLNDDNLQNNILKDIKNDSDNKFYLKKGKYGRRIPSLKY